MTLLYFLGLVILSFGMISIVIIGKILIMAIFMADNSRLLLVDVRIGSKLSSFILPISDRLLMINIIIFKNIRIILVCDITLISLIEQYTARVTNSALLIMMGVRYKNWVVIKLTILLSKVTARINRISDIKMLMKVPIISPNKFLFFSNIFIFD